MSRRYDPARHMQHAIGVEIDFRHLVGDQQDGETFGGELSDDLEYPTRAPTSTPTVGESRMISLRSMASHFAMATRCWFPPKGVNRVGCRADPDRQLLDQ